MASSGISISEVYLNTISNMTNEEIIEGNKLIAEFMGGKYISDGDSIWMGGNLVFLKHLKYNLLWDWLMPVVEKIEAMDGVSVFIKGASVDFYLYGFARAKKTEETKIKSTWLAVVEFINWYNNQNK